MTIREAKRLRTGDSVAWADPDSGECSRIVKIKKIRRWGESSFVIQEQDGAELWCFAHELGNPTV